MHVRQALIPLPWTLESIHNMLQIRAHSQPQYPHGEWIFLPLKISF
jgi:hypothetical protein